mmetsp:Transcript_3365/g.9541  ORF Transcript_3365/g.9541 Transcript_3365/m.9541 type:complete len:254 (+) Transcript_3365:899-1660(+)
MLRHGFVEVEVLAEHDGDLVELTTAYLARAVRSDEGHGERRAFFGLGLLERRIDLQRLVDGILGHCAVRRPFTAADSDESSWADVDDVVARELLGVVRIGIGITDKRAEPGPCCLDMRVIERVLADAVALPEDEVDVAHCRLRKVGHLALRIGGAGERRALPRQEVEDAAVLRKPEEAHLVGRGVVGHHQVRSWSGDHDVCGLWISHAADGVGEHTAGRDHLLSLDFVRLTGKHVAYFGANNLIVRLPTRTSG